MPGSPHHCIETVRRVIEFRRPGAKLILKLWKCSHVVPLPACGERCHRLSAHTLTTRRNDHLDRDGDTHRKCCVTNRNHGHFAAVVRLYDDVVCFPVDRSLNRSSTPTSGTETTRHIGKYKAFEAFLLTSIDELIHGMLTRNDDALLTSATRRVNAYGDTNEIRRFTWLDTISVDVITLPQSIFVLIHDLSIKLLTANLRALVIREQFITDVLLKIRVVVSRRVRDDNVMRCVLNELLDEQLRFRRRTRDPARCLTGTKTE